MKFKYCFFFVVRVKLKKVTAASAIPVARVGSTAESLRNVDQGGAEAIEMGRVSTRGPSMF